MVFFSDNLASLRYASSKRFSPVSNLHETNQTASLIAKRTSRAYGFTEHINDSKNQCDKSVQTKEPGAWLRAIPPAPVGNILDNLTFQISLGLRLGSEVVRSIDAYAVTSRIVVAIIH